MIISIGASSAFLSTPSGWRATVLHAMGVPDLYISIHALRVEGDGARSSRTSSPTNFYPRPPGGGRRIVRVSGASIQEFLSTPSGWRATSIKA